MADNQQQPETVRRWWRFGQIGTDSIPNYASAGLPRQAEILRDYIKRTEERLVHYREVLKGLEDRIANGEK